MTPDQHDYEADDRRDDVDDERKEPRHGDVRSSPKEPCFDVIFHVTAMFSRVRLVPKEVNENCWCDDDTREKRGADQGREEQRDNPV